MSKDNTKMGEEIHVEQTEVDMIEINDGKTVEMVFVDEVLQIKFNLHIY
jgi:hypothetical protein